MSRNLPHTHCHQVEGLVASHDCLWLEVYREEVSKRTMIPLTGLTYATHHQTNHFQEVHLLS